MSRADLLALTPEALAALANVGLVKRAQRDLESGAGPDLEERADGSVVGTFKDGVVAKLPPSTPLKEAACTCGAMGVCRHRLAVALAYKAWHAATDTGEAASQDAPWSPGEIDDATLERVLGTRLLERARGTLKKGLLATLERDGAPAARLPSCTVRFLVPRDVAYARCDCALAGGACEHLALAVWAFREAKAGAGPVVVAIGGSAVAETAAHRAALADATELVRDLLAAGVSETVPSPGRFAQLRKRLEQAGMTWVHAIVVDLEIALEGYHRRSALHGTREIAALVVELAARLRAGAGATSHELPARFVLGEDEAPETLLDHVRLVSLGARVRADERARFADVYLADPDTKLVLVLRKRWDYEDAEPEDGPQLARRAVAARVGLHAIAHGQLVSKVVTRKANRSIELGTSRVAHTSVTPQRGDWDSLPAPLLVRDLAEHVERLRTRPPRLLRPRVLAEEVHVVAVSEVRDVVYSSAEQELVAQLVDAAGHAFLLVARHRRVAPNALDAIAVALTKSVRFVAGELVRGAFQWQIDPLAIVGEELVVPDLAGTVAAIPAAARVRARAVNDLVHDALARAESILEELCGQGVTHPSAGLLERAAATAQQLDDAGLAGLAARFRALQAAICAGGASAADAWVDVAVRAALGREVALG